MSRLKFPAVDDVINSIDEGLRTLSGNYRVTGRENPADDISSVEPNEDEKQVSIGLMRVNHAGEVAAQGLYQGQALTARLPDIRSKMERAAQEENDHLAWCKSRLDELGGKTSVLDPFWYAGSFAIGALAGIAGDKWSLGFVAETEKQVGVHLQGHLEQLPEVDAKSRAVIEQMKVDEHQHETMARDAGGNELPEPVKQMMKMASRVMTTTAYRV